MAVLTVSRQFGAGGRTLGKRIAEKMGYTLIDEDMVGKIAQRARVSKNWVRSVEKEAGGSLLKFTSYLVSKRFINQILDDTRGYIDEEIYVSTLSEVINELAREDNCVIIGRAAQYVLRDFPKAFHVLLVAEMEDRLSFMVDNYNIKPEDAQTVIRVREKRRVNLYRKFGREDYNDPHLYHIVLNRSKVTMDQAVDIVCHLMSLDQE